MKCGACTFEGNTADSVIPDKKIKGVFNRRGYHSNGQEDWHAGIGDTFIPIASAHSFTIPSFSSYSRDECVDLYACPKCGTLHLFSNRAGGNQDV